MSVTEIVQQFIQGMHKTTWYEYVAVFAGIASVWFSRKEHILVYPIGLINTIIFIYISYKYHLLGEASVNFYYTVMSIYGWWLWSRKDAVKHETILHITYSTKKEWTQQLLFFSGIFVAYFLLLSLAKNYFFEGVIPAADAFATATAFTGMWLMAKKKVESWYWWIATNITSIPLYFVKTLVFTSVQYVILLILAVAGLITWIQKAKQLEHR
jgi:nicotinamide mononucleotide transporter